MKIINLDSDLLVYWIDVLEIAVKFIKAMLSITEAMHIIIPNSDSVKQAMKGMTLVVTRLDVLQIWLRDNVKSPTDAQPN